MDESRRPKRSARKTSAMHGAFDAVHLDQLPDRQ
jgi:hypothetical protein